MVDRLMTKRTFEFLKKRAEEVRLEIQRRGAESSGHQRASLHDDAGAENQLNLLRAELGRIGDLKGTAFIEAPTDTSTVQLGSRTSLEFSDGERDEYTLVSPDDVRFNTLPFPVVSYESPLGRAIKGKKRGDTAEYPLSAAPTRKETVKILDIKKGDL